VVANIPDVIYFQANVTFPDSVSILNADVASFTIDTSAPAEPAQCPCGIDNIKSQRISASQGDCCNFLSFSSQCQAKASKGCI